jgi:hypothetical protein
VAAPECELHDEGWARIRCRSGMAIMAAGQISYRDLGSDLARACVAVLETRLDHARDSRIRCESRISSERVRPLPDPTVGELLEAVAPALTGPRRGDDRALANPRIDDSDGVHAAPPQDHLDDRGACGEEPDPGLP